MRAAICLLLVLITLPAFAQKPPGSLRVATRVVPPFVVEDKGKLDGFSIDLWDSLAKKMGVQWQPQVKPSVVELLAAVKSGQADVGIAAISITADRDKEFDFSQPMFESGLQVMVRGKPSSGTTSPIAGLLALLFSPGMLIWLSIVLVMILVPAHIIWFVERYHKEGLIPTRSYFPGIFYAAWWAAGTLATQADSMPRHAISRVVAVLWMFTGVVFVAYFTAQVTASLTVQQLQGNIKGPDDLPGKKVATTKGSTSAAYLRDHGAQVQESAAIQDAYDALLKEDADAVVFDSPVLLYYAANDGKGKVQVVGSVFRKENYGIVVAPNSQLRKRIDAALLTLREDGTYDKLYDKWFSSK